MKEEFFKRRKSSINNKAYGLILALADKTEGSLPKDDKIIDAVADAAERVMHAYGIETCVPYQTETENEEPAYCSENGGCGNDGCPITD